MTLLDDRFVWFPGPLPRGLDVVQVYGWLFDETGRVLVQCTPEGFNLPGGSPEPEDVSLSATLLREAMEESQVCLGDPEVLGYEQQAGPGGRRGAGFVRVARITGVLPRHPDPDGGRLLGRRMVAWPTAVALLSWGEAGRAQGRAAADLAAYRWRFPVHAPSAPDAELA